MDALTLGTLTVLAVTGYGEVGDGRPTWAQRELHTYTNLVRVDPEAWVADYACSIAFFSSDERGPVAPLLYHDGLSEIAQLHSEDMAAHGLTAHESSDGTSFPDRVWPYYPGSTIGENVAHGYRDSASALWNGWMCSGGHRANIMSATFSHLGCGVQDTYYTQDFGGGVGGAEQPVAMGVHLPELPQDSVTFLATFEGRAPAWFGVETPDACLELTRFEGSARRGGWRLETSAEAGCVPYRFLWRTRGGGQGALPETGAYVYGQDCALWTDQPPEGCGGEVPVGDTGDTGCPQDDRDCDGVPDTSQPDPDDRDCGCSGSPGAALWPFLLASLGGLGLRRRGRRASRGGAPARDRSDPSAHEAGNPEHSWKEALVGYSSPDSASSEGALSASSRLSGVLSSFPSALAARRAARAARLASFLAALALARWFLSKR